MVKASHIREIQYSNVPEHLNFLGICLTKKCFAKKDAERAASLEASNQAKILKAEAKKIKAEAKAASIVELASKGVDGTFWGNFGKSLPQLLSGVAGVFGGASTGGIGGLLGGGGNTNAQETNYPTEQPQSNNTGLWVAGGIGLVVVGIIIWAIAKK